MGKPEFSFNALQLNIAFSMRAVRPHTPPEYSLLFQSNMDGHVMSLLDVFFWRRLF